MTFKCLRKECGHETEYQGSQKIKCPKCGCQLAVRIK